MGEVKSAMLENHQLDALGSMVEEGDADNESEALRTALNAGFADLGYRNGEKRDTALRQTSRRFADAFALLGLFLAGMTFFYPLGFRMLSVAPFAAALGCYGLDRALEAYEPAVSDRITGVLQGEKA